ncbi:MAG: hypothetical protein K6E63_03800 [Lachnospiraceae bacterium]|nr:hypothetical protein [Lachnospiraceae bacterium]
MTDINTELASMLFDNRPMMKRFNKDHYADAFDEYCESFKELFDEIDKGYAEAPDRDAYINDLAVYFRDQALEKYESIPKKGDRERFIIDYNPVLTVFVLPSLNGKGNEGCKALAKAIVGLWNETFKRYTISIGTFEEIDSGFKRKLCYITTAVCKSLGKPDDCYELKMLRDYRDSYLLKREKGRGIVDDYYNVAPTIVNRINRREDRNRIYRDIFDRYINPCIKLIEDGKEEECRKLYSDMVYNLEEEYMFCGR